MAYLTVEEARSKTCPVDPLNATSAGLVKCTANHCMMWRWSPADSDDIPGFCGLAGRPTDEVEAGATKEYTEVGGHA